MLTFMLHRLQPAGTLLLLLLASAFACVPARSQPNVFGTSTVIGPSPTAAGLGRYGDIPVSYYTGVPNISVPLYHTTVDGTPFDLALSYHASGIKVEEDASWVGLGWSLEAGGVITRTLHGVPDERGARGYVGTATNRGTAAVVENNLAVESGQFNGDFDQYLLIKDFADGVRDGEPDDFYFNFCGKSGRLFFDGTGKPYCSPYNFWRVAGDAVSGFVITDENGVQYDFRGLNTGDNVEVTEYSYGNGAEVGQYSSSWYLHCITYPNQETVEFGYVAGGTQSAKFGAVTATQLLCSASANGGAEPPYSYSVPDITTRAVVLATIRGRSFAADFAASGREDDYALVRLNTLTVRDNTGAGPGTITWSFKYQYDGGGVLQDTRGLGGLNSDRLVLHQLTRTGEPGYRFAYYGDDARHSVATQYRQDHWGYANNNAANYEVPAVALHYICGGLPIDLYLEGADKSPDFSSAIAYTLQRVTYPTGGSTVYDYEANDYGRDASGKPVADTVFSTPQYVAVNMNSTNAPANRIRTTADFILDHKQVIKFQ